MPSEKGQHPESVYDFLNFISRMYEEIYTYILICLKKDIQEGQARN